LSKTNRLQQKATIILSMRIMHFSRTTTMYLATATLFGATTLPTIDSFSLGPVLERQQLRSPRRFSQYPPLHAAARASGGRKSGQDDRINLSDEWEPTPCQPGEARLTVIQITDVYTLEHLASVKRLVEETREKSVGAKVVCVITGDFLSPYLLASVDRGQGMMDALNSIPMVRATKEMLVVGDVKILIRWC
jgi:hypothetical protein